MPGGVCSGKVPWSVQLEAGPGHTGQQGAPQKGAKEEQEKAKKESADDAGENHGGQDGEGHGEAFAAGQAGCGEERAGGRVVHGNGVWLRVWEVS